MIRKIRAAIKRGDLKETTLEWFRWRFSQIIHGLYYLFSLPFNRVENKRILFLTFQYDYTCNPKYICDEILRRKLPWDLVWVCRKYNSANFPEGVRTVRKASMAYFRAIRSAHIWIDNATTCCKYPLKKRKNQFFLETMHGSLGIKRIGAEGITTRDREKRITKVGALTDVIVSNSTFENGVYKDTYWKDTPVWLYGHARNDIFFRKDLKEIEEKVRKAFSLAEDVNLILYAPTIRPYQIKETFDAEAVLSACREKFGGTWKLLKKLHPSSKEETGTLGEDVIDARTYSDIQELMLACRVGITDYSSWIYDYVLSRKPGFLYVPDVKKYDQAKGFYYPLSETPFPVAETSKDLKQAILDFEEEEYQKRIDAFLEARGCVEDGHAAERIVDKLEELVKNAV